MGKDAQGKAALELGDDIDVKDSLDEAAAKATENIKEEVVGENVVEEEIVEKEVANETDSDGLPTDHKARSDLGRKFSALHRRQDEFDSKLDRLLDALSKSTEKQEDPVDYDEPMTKAEAFQYFKQLQEENSKAEIQYKQKYQNSYDSTLIDLSSGYTDDEANEIFNELQNLRYNPSQDPERDAELNFLKAERAYLRKKTASPKKVAPLKKDTPVGVMTSDKAPEKKKIEVKLSAAGKSYLDYVANRDGTEKAKSLIDSING